MHPQMRYTRHLAAQLECSCSVHVGREVRSRRKRRTSERREHLYFDRSILHGRMIALVVHSIYPPQSSATPVSRRIPLPPDAAYLGLQNPFYSQ
jgi:hypothetical protein